MSVTGPWGTVRCHVAQFIPWMRPDKTFAAENDPRSGFVDFVSRWPIRAGSKFCEHLMGGVIALDSAGFARLHVCSATGKNAATQSRGFMFLESDGNFMHAVAPYSNPRAQWASWYGNSPGVQA